MSRNTITESGDEALTVLNTKLDNLSEILNEASPRYTSYFPDISFVNILNIIKGGTKDRIGRNFYGIIKSLSSIEKDSGEDLIAINTLNLFFESYPLIESYFLNDNQNVYEAYYAIRDLFNLEDKKNPEKIYEFKDSIISIAIYRLKRQLKESGNNFEYNKIERERIQENQKKIDRETKERKNQIASLNMAMEDFTLPLERARAIIDESKKIREEKLTLINTRYKYEDKITDMEYEMRAIGENEEDIQEEIREILENEEAKNKVDQDDQFNVIDELQERLTEIQIIKKNILADRQNLQHINIQINKLENKLKNLDEESGKIKEALEDSQKYIGESHLIKLEILKLDQYQALIATRKNKIITNKIDEANKNLEKEINNNMKTLENLEKIQDNNLSILLTDLAINDIPGFSKVLQGIVEYPTYFYHVNLFAIKNMEGKNLLEIVFTGERSVSYKETLVSALVLKAGSPNQLIEYFQSSEIDEKIKQHLIDYANQEDVQALINQKKQTMRNGQQDEKVSAATSVAENQREAQAPGEEVQQLREASGSTQPLESKQLNGRKEKTRTNR